MSKSTEFGAGILEDVVLTDREIAIAQGEDPDAMAVDDSTEVQVDGSDEGNGSDGDGGGDGNAASSVESESVNSWSDEDKEIAAKHGLNDDDLADLGSSKALRKAVAVLERTKAQSASGVADSPASDAAGGDATSNKSKDETNQNGLPKLNLEKLRETFGEDPDTMEVIETLAKTQEYIEQSEKRMQDRIERFEQQALAQELARNNEIFHSMLDEYPEEFGASVKGGKAVELAKEQEAARLKVKEAAETIYAGLTAKKAEIPSLQKIVEMAIRQVNGVPRKTTDRRQALVTQSSLRKTPGSAAAAVRRTTPPPDGSPESIASHPEIDRFWKEAQEANGVS